MMRNDKMRPITFGGDFVCPKCHQLCSGAEYHHCPEEKKQKRMTDYLPENQIEVTCPHCKKKRKIPLRNRPFFGDITICDECRKSVPDECGYFEEGKYNVYEQSPKKTKPWGV